MLANTRRRVSRNPTMKRGRPKGRSCDARSFGPLGDLIRNHRINKGLGLMDVAKACACSVQFVSNIEHGRASVPWGKIPKLASALKIPVAELQAANMAVRSEFQSFMTAGKSKKVDSAFGIPGRVSSPIGSQISNQRPIQRPIKTSRKIPGKISRKTFSTNIQKRLARAAKQILTH